MKSSFTLSVLATAGMVVASPFNPEHGRFHRVLHVHKRSDAATEMGIAGKTISGNLVGSACAGFHTVQAGEYCNSVAQTYNIDVKQFMSWNPSVGAPDCKNLWLGYQYCVKVPGGSATSPPPANAPVAAAAAPSQASPSSSPAAASPIPATPNQDSATGSPALSQKNTVSSQASSGTDSSCSAPPSGYIKSTPWKDYKIGTDLNTWPKMDEWLSFDQLWQINAPMYLTKGCIPDFLASQQNIAEENNDLYCAIKQVAGESGIDASFIFAIVLQESHGCMRVKTTANGVTNPGLMQSHNGVGSCFTIGTAPCPKSTILQMLRDGTIGTSSGDGYKSIFSSADFIRDYGTERSAANYYRASRQYNSGSIAPSKDINDGNGSTASYCQDVANRLLGWSEYNS